MSHDTLSKCIPQLTDVSSFKHSIHIDLDGVVISLLDMISLDKSALEFPL